MKRLSTLLLAGGLMAGVFSITAYTTAGAGALTSQLATISQGGGFENKPLLGDFREMTGSESEKVRHEERIDRQLEPFDKACEESIKEFYLGLAQEKEPQLEPFDKACEESIKESYLGLPQEKEPQLEPFDKACEESIKEFYVRLAQEKEPQLEPFDKACEESTKEYYLKLAQEIEPQLEPFDKACEESIKELYLRLAQEIQRMDTEVTFAK